MDVGNISPKRKNSKHKHMKPKDFALRCLAVVCAVVIVSCVDKNYNLDDVSTEVTVITNKTKLFIGELENKSIGDLLGDKEVDGLVKDENGNYTYSYSGEGDSQTIDGIQTEFTLPGINTIFTVDYPSFNLNMEGIHIKEESDVDVNNFYSDISDILGISGEGEYILTEELLEYIPIIEGDYSRCFNGDNMHLVFDLPEQVDNIKTLILKDVESGHHGAPIHLTVAFNDLVGINGGGHIDFKLNLSGGTFRLADKSGNIICDGNEYTTRYDVEDGADKVDFVIYVESIENTTALNDHHKLDIPLELTCDMNFEIEAKAGRFSLIDKPRFAIFADFEYGDAEIVMNEDVSLVEYHPTEPQQVKISNLPKELKSVNTITLKDDTTINLYAKGLSWLGDTAEKVAVEIALPDYFVLHAIEDARYQYIESEHKLITTIADIDAGVELNVESFDFGTEGLSPNEDGEIVIDLPMDIGAHFIDSENILVSSLVHNGKLDIETGIEDMVLDILSVSGKVDYTYTIEQEFAINRDNIDDAIDLDAIVIEGVGISPIITINLNNPLTMPLNVVGVLADDTGRRFEIKDVVLGAATYENGDIVPSKNKIVIAGERPEYDCTFVEVDFDELLAGVVPSLLSVELAVSVDSSEKHTLYVDDVFAINYDYSIDVPVALNNKLSISYADEFGGFSSIFSQVAQYDVHVGDVTIVVEITNTTPLALLAEAELQDENGEAVDLIVEFEEGNGRVDGSKDGNAEKVSTLRLNVANKDGKGLDVAKLAEVDGIAFKVSAKSDAEGDVAINEDQYIGATLWLELSNVTADIKDFIGSNK